MILKFNFAVQTDIVSENGKDAMELITVPMDQMSKVANSVVMTISSATMLSALTKLWYVMVYLTAMAERMNWNAPKVDHNFNHSFSSKNLNSSLSCTVTHLCFIMTCVLYFRVLVAASQCVLSCMLLYCIVSCCIMLYRVALCCIMLYFVVSCCIMFYYVVLLCIVYF